MNKTAEYLELCETPRVKLCTFASKIRRAGMFLAMGRQGNKYYFTKAVQKDLQDSCNELRIIGNTEEDLMIRKILNCVMPLLKQTESEKEMYVSSHLFKKLVSTLAEEPINQYLPGGPIYDECRRQLWTSQGLEPPQN